MPSRQEKKKAKRRAKYLRRRIRFSPSGTIEQSLKRSGPLNVKTIEQNLKRNGPLDAQGIEMRLVGGGGGGGGGAVCFWPDTKCVRWFDRAGE